MTPQAFIFMGRYGAGKGTQADFLMKKLKEKDPSHPILYVETGREFRKFNEGDSYTAKLSKTIVDSGKLMPEYMCVYLWGRLLVDRYTGAEHLVFDGTPRRILEAKMLEDLFPFYGLDKPWLIYLDVEHDESHKRLTLRGKTSGRADDHPSAMEARKIAYEADVVPSIEYYKTSPNVRFLDIYGERTIEEIHADIVQRVGLALSHFMIRLKTKEDIAVLREGGHRHAAILRELAAMVRPGITARELNDCADELIKAGGDQSAFFDYQPVGAKRPFPASLCVSVNDEVVHGIPNEEEKVLAEGDIVSLDLGLVHKGMITDAAVTVPVGKVSPKLEKLLEDTKRALMAGIKEAKGGRRVGDISSAIERAGIAGKYGIVEDLSGHGVGYHVHEDPYVPNYGEAGQGEVLQPGMVLAIEPMFNMGTHEVVLDDDGYTYLTGDGTPSAHFEHTILITKGDAEILTA